MAEILSSLIGLQKGEQKMTLLMASYHFLLLIILYLLKPVRDSLFLADRGPSELPYVFIITTVLVVPVVVLHTRLGRSLRVGRLIDGVTFFLALNLIGLHGLVSSAVAWAPYVLYAWVSIFSLLVTSQFWLLANAIFGASQAKRVFTVLSAGAILGSVAGGEITGLLVHQLDVSSVNLLYVAAVLLLGSIGWVRWIRWHHRQQGGRIGEATHISQESSGQEPSRNGAGPDGKAKEPVPNRDEPRRIDEPRKIAETGNGDEGTVSAKEQVDAAETADRDEEQSTTRRLAGPGKAMGAGAVIARSRHIQLIVAVIALMVLTSTFVDFQFKTVAAEAFSGEDSLTSFMGRFYGRVSLVALVVQFLIAPRLIRVLGIGGALSALPIALAGGALAMIAVPGLVAGIALRGADQTLKHSIDKTGRELLFVPVPLKTKKRVKVFVDLFVDQGAQGVAGVLLLLLTAGLGFGTTGLGIVTLGLLAAWGVAAYLARRSYVNEFRQRLRTQEAKLEAEEATSEVSQDLDELLMSLCSRGETESLAALDRLERGDMTVPVDALVCLLDHYSSDVRAKAIRVLRKRTIEGRGSDVVEALRDPDPDVQLEAARYLYCQSGHRAERLQQALSHDDVRIQAAAVGLLAEEGDPSTYRLVTEPMLRRLLQVPGEAGEDARTHVARILGVLDRSYRVEMLQSLLHDPSDQVVEAAIEAAGRSEERAFIYPLLKRLRDPEFEAPARRALANYGQRALGTLYDVMVDDRTDLSVRQQIPMILAAMHQPLAVTILTAALNDAPVPVRHQIVRALSKLHAADTGSFDIDAISEAIRDEIEHYAVLGQIVYLLPQDHRHPLGTVGREDVRAARSESLERIFRLLGCKYDQRDVYDAYLGLTSDDPALRSSAVEFADNLVDYSTSRILLPLLEDDDGSKAAEYGPRHFDRSIDSVHDAWDYLSDLDDPSLQPLPEPRISPAAGSGDGAVEPEDAEPATAS